jgi:hypothetical protein
MTDVMMTKVLNGTDTNLNFQMTVFQGVDGTFWAKVEMIEGAADINAIYFGDSVIDGSSFSLGKSVGMNGGGQIDQQGNVIDWDDGIKLSDPGLGKYGDTKDTYLTEGESMFVSLSGITSWAELEHIGVRATSTSTPAGSIKCILEPADQVIDPPPSDTADAPPPVDSPVVAVVETPPAPVSEPTPALVETAPAEPAPDQAETPALIESPVVSEVTTPPVEDSADTATDEALVSDTATDEAPVSDTATDEAPVDGAVDEGTGPADQEVVIANTIDSDQAFYEDIMLPAEPDSEDDLALEDGAGDGTSDIGYIL